MTIVTVGIDLAKNIFAVHGVDACGKPPWRVYRILCRRKIQRGRSFSAWLGLVPGQYSSGGKQRLGRITKAGDAYLRSLLVMGARAVLAAAMNTRAPKQDGLSRWARSLAERRGYWRAVVAIAAKNARMCWAVLQRRESFKMPA